METPDASVCVWAGMMPVRQAAKRGRSQDLLRAIPFHMQDSGQEQAGAVGPGPSSTLGPLPQEGAPPTALGQGPLAAGPNFTLADEDFPSLTAAKAPSAKGPAAKGPSSKNSKALDSNPAAGPARAAAASLSRTNVRRPASEPDLSGSGQQDLA